MSDESKPTLPTPSLVAGYARVLQRYDLTQVEIVSAELSLVLRRDPPKVALPSNPVAYMPLGSNPAHTGLDANQQANLVPSKDNAHPNQSGVSVETNESVREDADEHVLRAQMLGTAYLSRSPGTPPFISIGDTVKTGDVVMIIEAMKVMNQVIAHRDGRVHKILVNDGDPVEFDQPLIVIN